MYKKLKFPPNSKVLGVTSVDISTPADIYSPETDTVFFFGQAFSKGNMALISIRRMDPRYYVGGKPNDELAIQRMQKEATERFIKCGDLREGFARVRCDDCGHDLFVSFSCKVRCFCPSCHQKRVLELSMHVREKVFAPVPHRQFVFTIPKRLRIHTHLGCKFKIDCEDFGNCFVF